MVVLTYLVFTHIIRMPGEGYRRRLRSLLRSCDVLRGLITSLVFFFLSASLLSGNEDVTPKFHEGKGCMDNCHCLRIT